MYIVFQKLTKNVINTSCSKEKEIRMTELIFEIKNEL